VLNVASVHIRREEYDILVVCSSHALRIIEREPLQFARLNDAEPFDPAGESLLARLAVAHPLVGHKSSRAGRAAGPPASRTTAEARSRHAINAEKRVCLFMGFRRKLHSIARTLVGRGRELSAIEDWRLGLRILVSGKRRRRRRGRRHNIQGASREAT
jgi:hypothetical protein